MANKVNPYSQQGSKREQVETMFDKIAPYYDFLNHLLTLNIDVLWRKKTINTIQSPQTKKVLDIATGTGDLAIMAAKKLNPTKIVGLDLSEKMLVIGQEKVNKKKLDHLITLIQGDSENLPFEDNTFDAITVGFGVRNFENLEKGLREIYRVLKPDGKLAILEFSMPTVFPIKQGYHFYFKYILPLIGRITSKDPRAYTYLYESVQAFPDGEKFTTILEGVKFKSSKCKPLTLGICSIYTATK